MSSGGPDTGAGGHDSRTVEHTTVKGIFQGYVQESRGTLVAQGGKSGHELGLRVFQSDQRAVAHQLGGADSKCIRRSVFADMYMTVDEARHHEFIAQVNDLITLLAEALLVHDILYALALDQDNLVLAYAAVYGVEQLSAFNCFIHSITSLRYFRESRYV